MKWKPDWTDIAENLLIGLLAVAAAAIFIVFCVCVWKDVTTERTIIMRDGSQSYACSISDISPTPIRLQANRGRGMSAYQPVLDPACGGRMFWFDKSDSRVLFGDVRDESWELCDGRRFEVKPDMLMDYRDLPFPDETFRMVVLDPPHLRNAGETSYMAQKYGCLDQETWKNDLKTMFSECFRVLQPCGTLIFKWNETQIPVSQILKLTDHKPLFGNKQPNRTGTHWIVFIKEDTE